VRTSNPPLNQCSSHRVRKQNSYPYETHQDNRIPQRIIFLYSSCTVTLCYICHEDNFCVRNHINESRQ
jgi:hypothetical protein